jgi:hypothetical protein
LAAKEYLAEIVSGIRITLETIENDLGLHDYGIPRSAWIRGIKLMNHFGAERALEVIDERAQRAADRGDYETARRWRTLITAIHAAQEDERLRGDSMH